MPNASKILVIHLRKVGQKGYISDFCNMGKNVLALTGDIGVEVLLVVPVVYEGLDVEGGRLVSEVKDWIEWIGEESGRGNL